MEDRRLGDRERELPPFGLEGAEPGVVLEDEPL
jgi:hypothetical protein